MGKIQYSPELTIEEMAKRADVSEASVRKFIRENCIDRSYDSQLIRFRRVQQYFKDYPDATLSEAAAALGEGYTRNTVEKFRHPENAPLPNRSRISLSMIDPSSSKYAVASASFEDRIILGIILRLYFESDDRFDCDFTFSKGDFYKYGVQYPRHCFDLYPEYNSGLVDAPEVLPLERGEVVLQDNSLASVVIDLPQAISEQGEGNPNEFKDLRDLALSYYKMLSLSYRKLRHLTDTQSGGLLIVKVGDIRWKGRMIWLSKIVTELATGKTTRLSAPILYELKVEAESKGVSIVEEFPLFDMELVDKFVHTYDPDTLDAREYRDHSVKAHDYFLVFRKGREAIDYDTFYLGSETEIEGDTLSADFASESAYGVKVVSRKSLVADKYPYVYEVRLPQRNDKNRIDTHGIFSAEIRDSIYKRFGVVIPYSQCMKGAQAIEYLESKIAEQLTATSHEEESKRAIPNMTERKEAVAELLRDCGVQYIEETSGDKRRQRDYTRIVLDPSVIKLIRI